MTGDRREVHPVRGTGMGPVDDDMGGDLEDRTVTYVGGRRAYHVRADVVSEFSAGESTSRGYSILADVESTFKARAEGDVEPGDDLFFLARPEEPEPEVIVRSAPEPRETVRLAPHPTAWERFKGWLSGR